MKLDVIRLGCTVSAVWGASVFFTGLANLLWPAYAVGFLKVIDSIYPGYHFGQWGMGGVLVATLYAAVDGWIVGAIFSWLYNLFTKKKRV